MTTVAALTLSALSTNSAPSLSHYGASLTAAAEAHPPPFGMAWYGQKYRAISSDPQWMAGSLIANAAKEGEGARKLWELAGRIGDEATADQVRQHAIDESRHARLYVAMLDLVFPEAVTDDLRPHLRALAPRYTADERPPTGDLSRPELILDELVQMNIGEIRTRIHQLLLRPVLTAYCQREVRPRLRRVLDSLLRDETRHVQYTGLLIEQAAENGWHRYLRELMRRRLQEFNEITLAEVGEEKFVGE